MLSFFKGSGGPKVANSHGCEALGGGGMGAQLPCQSVVQPVPLANPCHLASSAPSRKAAGAAGAAKRRLDLSLGHIGTQGAFYA